MAVGFALAWLTVDKLHWSFWAMMLGMAGGWVGWESLFGRSAPSARSDIPALAYGIVTGFAFPWIGVGLAGLIEFARF